MVQNLAEFVELVGILFQVDNQLRVEAEQKILVLVNQSPEFVLN